MLLETKQLCLLQLVEEIDGYAILLLDKNGNIESWNKGAEKIKGYTRDEAIGQNFSIFYTKEDRHAGLPERLLAEAAAKGTVATEAWRVKKDGTRFWGLVTIMAIFGDDQQFTGFAKVTADLTQRRMLETSIRAYAAELEAKNKEIEQFVYIASHDLQEPLATVTGLIGMFTEESRDQLDENARLYLRHITETTERMRNLIRSLLQYSSIGTRNKMVSCDLTKLLQQVTTDLHRLISEAGAIIHLTNLPVIRGCPIDLAQLFQNLISNAIKFCRKGIKPEITISAVKDKNEWQISFADNGIGIESRHHQKIFLIFQRLQGKGEYEGNGIGLAHCKKIAELHGGHISVQPNKGHGSIFTVTLPIQR